MKNFYSVLSIDINSTQEQIKKAYKFHASKFHPDKHGGDEFFKDKFIEVQEAYSVLADIQKKTNYDAALNEFLNPKRGHSDHTSKSAEPSKTNDSQRESSLEEAVQKHIYWIQEWFNKGNWRKALEEVDEAIRKYPSYAYLYHIKADILRDINLPKDALKAYKKASMMGCDESKTIVIELETLKSESEAIYEKILYRAGIFHLLLVFIIGIKPESYDKFGYSMLTVMAMFALWVTYIVIASKKIPMEGKTMLNSSGTIILLTSISMIAFFGLPFFI